MFGVDAVLLVSLAVSTPALTPVALTGAVGCVAGIAAIGGRAGLAGLLATLSGAALLWAQGLTPMDVGTGPHLEWLQLGALAGAAWLVTSVWPAGIRACQVEAVGLRREVALQSRRLAASNASLLEQNQALEQFNAAVGHDLRSPLTALKLSLAMARESDDMSEAVESLDEGLLAVSRMESMVTELFGLAQAGRRLVDVQPVSLDASLGQAVDQLRARIQESGGKVEIRGPLPEALGSAALLAQVAQNLIENGLKYGDPDAPVVRVLGGRIGPEVFFEVEDNGVGVPSRDRSRIFSPFIQLAGARSGMGAGLALVQRIVAAHGGRVQVAESAGLGGACFRVLLPASTVGSVPVAELRCEEVARGIVLPFAMRQREEAAS